MVGNFNRDSAFPAGNDRSIANGEYRLKPSGDRRRDPNLNIATLRFSRPAPWAQRETLLKKSLTLRALEPP